MSTSDHFLTSQWLLQVFVIVLHTVASGLHRWLESRRGALGEKDLSLTVLHDDFVLHSKNRGTTLTRKVFVVDNVRE